MEPAADRLSFVGSPSTFAGAPIRATVGLRQVGLSSLSANPLSTYNTGPPIGLLNQRHSGLFTVAPQIYDEPPGSAWAPEPDYETDEIDNEERQPYAVPESTEAPSADKDLPPSFSEALQGGYPQAADKSDSGVAVATPSTIFHQPRQRRRSRQQQPQQPTPPTKQCRRPKSRSGGGGARTTVVAVTSRDGAYGSFAGVDVRLSSHVVVGYTAVAAMTVDGEGSPLLLQRQRPRVAVRRVASDGQEEACCVCFHW